MNIPCSIRNVWNKDGTDLQGIELAVIKDKGKVFLKKSGLNRLKKMGYMVTKIEFTRTENENSNR